MDSICIFRLKPVLQRPLTFCSFLMATWNLEGLKCCCPVCGSLWVSSCLQGGPCLPLPQLGDLPFQEAAGRESCCSSPSLSIWTNFLYLVFSSLCTSSRADEDQLRDQTSVWWVAPKVTGAGRVSGNGWPLTKGLV